MYQITININNSTKTKAFISFIKQLDFIEIIEETEKIEKNKENWKNDFASIGVWNIDENKIKLKDWKLPQF